MNLEELRESIFQKGSFLCVGLDSDFDRIPSVLKRESDPQFEFNKKIIDATRESCVAYKINTAFYEATGVKGWKAMARTAEYIGKEHFIIADAKRGDIGNTCDQYARAFFDEMNFDAITLAPYMGEDSISPFLKYTSKYSILLALTSNPSAVDFEYFGTEEHPLFREVIRKSQGWQGAERIMYVVGATRPGAFRSIRELAPDAFLLVPGVGAQGGSLEEVAKYGLTKNGGILVNSSRSIIFASEGNDFAEAAATEAWKIQKQMHELLSKYLTK